MTQTFGFDATSARHAFPYLVAGQAQKEFFVNEALARIDALLHPVVEGELGAPPASPASGQCWIVASGAAGEWADHDSEIAAWDGTQWTYCAPVAGMLAFDIGAGERIAFDGAWQRAVRPPQPTGGPVVDTEARAALAALIDTLATLSIIPAD